MMGLSDGRKSFSDRFSRFDTIPECDGHPASHVAVAITLNAQASSLMTCLGEINASNFASKKTKAGPEHCLCVA